MSVKQAKKVIDSLWKVHRDEDTEEDEEYSNGLDVALFRLERLAETT